MKNIKKVFMLVASLGLAVGTISSVCAGSQTKSLSVGHQESTEFRNSHRPDGWSYGGVSTQKKQDLPNTIPVSSRGCQEGWGPCRPGTPGVAPQSMSTEKKQDLPNTITVNGVKYKKRE